jgi:hypothetical protein
MTDEKSQGQKASFARLTRSAAAFLQDYAERHRNPVNAALHIVGVPAVFYGLFWATTGRSGRHRALGLAFIVFGYFLQYLGHKKQGNEVGEVSLIKFLLAKTREASWRRMRSYKWFSEGPGEKEEKRATGEAVGAGKGKSSNGDGHGNGNGHNGGSGNGASAGRYILWWKTSH